MIYCCSDFLLRTMARRKLFVFNCKCMDEGLLRSGEGEDIIRETDLEDMYRILTTILEIVLTIVRPRHETTGSEARIDRIKR